MIDYYVNEIRTCLSNRCYFAALSLTLMLPDICGVAEYPDKQVAERYISWYDNCLGAYLKQERMFEGQPYLSGEIVYNLRNTFFHQGKADIIASKVRETQNQIDRFTLILGDGTVMHTVSLTVNAGDVWYRNIFVDVVFLCGIICDAAQWYYQNNKEKFDNTIRAVPQEWLFGETSPLDGVLRDSDPIGDALNEKFRASGQNIRIQDHVTDRLCQTFCKYDLFVKQRELLDEGAQDESGKGNENE